MCSAAATCKLWDWRVRHGKRMPIHMSARLSDPDPTSPYLCLEIKHKGEVIRYDLEEVAEHGGRRILLWYAAAPEHAVVERDGHAVFISDYDAQLDSCSCKGRAYVGRCKHVSALRALIAAGTLLDPRSGPAPAAVAEASEPIAF